MTRGKLIYLLNENGDCIVSQEFNGDMGDDMECGQMALRKLKSCESEEQFRLIVLDFIKEFDYTDDWTSEQLNRGDVVFKKNLIDKPFSNTDGNNYFDNWFSDYLYILNNTGSTVVTKDYDGKDLEIGAGITVLDFGHKIDPEHPDVMDEDQEAVAADMDGEESIFDILTEMKDSSVAYVLELAKRIEKVLGLNKGRD